MANELGAIRQELSDLKKYTYDGFEWVREEFRAVHQEIHVLGVQYEAMEDNLEKVLEIVTDMRDSYRKVPKLESDMKDRKLYEQAIMASLRATNEDVQTHDKRISRLEQAAS